VTQSLENTNIANVICYIPKMYGVPVYSICCILYGRLHDIPPSSSTIGRFLCKFVEHAFIGGTFYANLLEWC